MVATVVDLVNLQLTELAPAGSKPAYSLPENRLVRGCHPLSYCRTHLLLLFTSSCLLHDVNIGLVSRSFLIEQWVKLWRFGVLLVDPLGEVASPSYLLTSSVGLSQPKFRDLSSSAMVGRKLNHVHGPTTTHVTY